MVLVARYAVRSMPGRSGRRRRDVVARQRPRHVHIGEHERQDHGDGSAHGRILVVQPQAGQGVPQWLLPPEVVYEGVPAMERIHGAAPDDHETHLH